MTIKTRSQFFELFTHNSQYMRDFVDTIMPAKNVTGPGTGITLGTGTLIKSGVQRIGEIIKTSVLIDLTGLKSATSIVDIIGEATTAGPASLFQVKAAENGTILAGKMTCLELPASLTDIDLYSATVSTGVHEDGIAALDEVILVTAAAAWVNGMVKGFTAVPRANDFLYLVNGAADTADVFTAGKFLIELFGYDA